MESLALSSVAKTGNSTLVLSLDAYLYRCIPRVITALGLQNVTELLARTLRYKFQCTQRTQMAQMTFSTVLDNVAAAELEESMEQTPEDKEWDLYFCPDGSGVNAHNVDLIMRLYEWSYNVQTARAKYQLVKSNSRGDSNAKTQQMQDDGDDNDADDDAIENDDDEDTSSYEKDRRNSVKLWRVVSRADIPTYIQCWRIPPDSICTPPVPKICVEEQEAEPMPDLFQRIDQALRHLSS